MSRRGEVTTLRLTCPPPSAWDAGHTTRFLRTLQALSQRPNLTAVVLTGDCVFDELPNSGQRPVELEAVLDAVAASPIPVFAAIPGAARGSGLELALACAGRVATPTSTFSLPGVAFGRLPGPGALARLPKLIGAEAAATMAALGEILAAPAALDIGLIDAVARDDIVAVALEMASGPQSRLISAKSATPARSEADFFPVRLNLRRRAAGQHAPLAALRAMELAATLPARRVAAEVSRLAAELSRSSQGAALRYAAAGHMALAQQAGLTSAQIDAIARSLRWPMMREAIHLVDEGATPAQIDRCFEGFGFQEGPFSQSDRDGLMSVFCGPAGHPPGAGAWVAYSATLDLMADAGRHGGAAPGWYRRGEGAVRFDADVARLIGSSAICQRLHRNPVDDETIIQRCRLAAVTATAEALDDQRGCGLTPEMLDAIWTRQLDFPLWRGGPLYQAQQLGLRRVVENLERHRSRRDTLGPPSEILVRSAAQGGWSVGSSSSAKSAPDAVSAPLRLTEPA